MTTLFVVLWAATGIYAFLRLIYAIGGYLTVGDVLVSLVCAFLGPLVFLYWVFYWPTEGRGALSRFFERRIL